MSTSQFFRQTIYFATDIDVGWLDIFLIQSKQKNRKPEPAVNNYSLSLFLFPVNKLISPSAVVPVKTLPAICLPVAIK